MIRFASVLAFAFAFALAGAASPGVAESARPPQAPAAIAAGGAFRVEIELDVSDAFPDATAISLNVQASATDATFINSASASAQAVVSGRKVVAVVTLPYRWRLASAGADVHVSVGASAYTADIDASSLYDQQIKLPADGAATTIRISGAI